MRYGPNRAVKQAASRRLDAIVVGERYRRDPGNIAALAASIDELGLLHPIVIRPDGTLIAGARRLAAVALLGWTNVAVRVIDMDEIARGEFAENVCRKDFTLSEAVAIKRALEPVEREAAKERQREGGRAGRQASGNLPQASKGRAADRAAKATGMARRTLEKAEAVVAPPRRSRSDSESSSPTWIAPDARMESIGACRISELRKRSAQHRRHCQDEGRTPPDSSMFPGLTNCWARPP